MFPRKGKGLSKGRLTYKQHGITNIPSLISSTSTTPLSTLYLGPYRSTQDSLSINNNNSLPPKYPNLADPSLLPRCKNLHTLSITLHPSNPEYDPSSEDFYMSLAIFVSEVRPRSFVFKLVDDTYLTGMALKGLGSRNKTSMNRLQGNVFPEAFLGMLLPVLVGGWEGLKRVEVRGVEGVLLTEMGEKLGARGVLVVADRENT